MRWASARRWIRLCWGVYAYASAPPKWERQLVNERAYCLKTLREAARNRVAI